jgi:hypothetical protein
MLTVLTGMIITGVAFAGSGELMLIYSGDIHGYLVPRHNVRMRCLQKNLLK